MKVTIQRRLRIEVNTDPQRRCYDDYHFSSEFQWTSWQDLETLDVEKAEERLKFWRELNDYAISQRGESARAEFAIKE